MESSTSGSSVSAPSTYLTANSMGQDFPSRSLSAGRDAPPIEPRPSIPTGPNVRGAVSSGETGRKCHCKALGKDEDGNPMFGRNLVVCIDGTSNQFGDKNTNVIELYSQLIKDKTQLTYYNSGIGTYAKPSRSHLRLWIDSKIDLAIAWNFERTVKKAYRWLAENYQEGDRIFLFGFSRGAYQVRALAGMLDKVGLIHKGNDEQIPFAYELYLAAEDTKKEEKPKPGLKLSNFFNLRKKSSDPSKDSEPPKQEEVTSKAERFKETFSRPDVRAHLVGVWDTVSSVGIVRRKNLPGTVSQEHICYFRHALALDERRVKFLPEFALGGATLRIQKPAQSLPHSEDPTAARAEQLDTPPPPEVKSGKDTSSEYQHLAPHVKEVWFAGTHSDVGGGTVLNQTLDRRHPSFLWMSYEAISAGLKQDHKKVELKYEELDNIHESLTSIWRLFEWVPIKRLSYKDEDATTRSWHCGRGRMILPGQKVHASVAFCKKSYCPKATLPHPKSGRSWGTLIDTGRVDDLYWKDDWEDILEMDLFDILGAEECVNNITDSLTDPPVWVHRLKTISLSSDGCEMLRTVKDADLRLITSITNRAPRFQADIVDSVVRFTERFDTIIDLLQSFPGESLVHILSTRGASMQQLKLVSSLVSDGRCRQEILQSHEFAASLQVMRSVSTSPIKLLRELAICGDARPKIMTMANTLDKIFDSLRLRVDDDYWEVPLAIDTITELIDIRHADSRTKILEYRTYIGLCTALKHKDWSCRKSACMLITELLKDAGSRPKVTETKIMNDLLDKLVDRNPDVAKSASDAVAELWKHNDLNQDIIQTQAISDLAAGLNSQDSGIRHSSCQSIADLAKLASVRPRILESSIVGALLCMFIDRDSDSGVAEAAVDAVAELMRHGDSRSMVETSPFPDLCDSLKSDDWHIRRSTCKSIAKLATHGGLRPLVLKSDIFVALLATLTDSDAEVVSSAVDAVVELAKQADSQEDSREMLLGSDSDVFRTLDLRACLNLDHRPHEPRKYRVIRAQSICDLITELARYGGLRPKISVPEIRKSLEELLAKSIEVQDGGVRVAAEAAISVLDGLGTIPDDPESS